MKQKSSKFTAPTCLKLLQILYKRITWQEFSLHFHQFKKYVNIYISQSMRYNIFWLFVKVQPDGAQDSFIFCNFPFKVFFQEFIPNSVF